MSRILLGTRFLILLPIFGLAVSAILFFVFGGIGLIRFLVTFVIEALHTVGQGGQLDKGMFIYEVVEYVHTFLVGTVLYITAVGLYQLFVQEIKFPLWLKVESTEELETNLIGVTVVVLAVNFMGAIFAGGTENLLQYGAGIALPIAALGLFVGLRAWADRQKALAKSLDAAGAGGAPADSHDT
jgi:uncharacterized membrane protein YqhA